ncbi:hypothetical protein XBJ2_1710009 [Xenorhabdus bovienii str. Jollieti]|nr:hypothetical protein XBJ2_1710009 [Xenorhabdus bovienii str. Jollieti]
MGIGTAQDDKSPRCVRHYYFHLIKMQLQEIRRVRIINIIPSTIMGYFCPDLFHPSSVPSRGSTRVPYH